MTFLLAWGIGVASSPYSGINLAMHGRYGHRTLDSLKWNGLYSLAMLLLSIVVLDSYARLFLA